MIVCDTAPTISDIQPLSIQELEEIEDKIREDETILQDNQELSHDYIQTNKEDDNNHHYQPQPIKRVVVVATTQKQKNRIEKHNKDNALRLQNLCTYYIDREAERRRKEKEQQQKRCKHG